MTESFESYDDIEHIVEDLVRIKAKLWAKRYMSWEDIAQEIRQKCWKSLEKYNPESGKLKTYLNVITENHLRNLIRDKFATFSPPCRKTCSHYDEAGRPTDDAQNCASFRAYWKRYRAKCNVRMPASVDRAFESAAEGLPAKCKYQKGIDLDMSIRDALKSQHYRLVEFYDMLIQGYKIPPKIQAQIRAIVAEMLEG